MKVIAEGTRIINVDESTLKHLDFVGKVWLPKGVNVQIPRKPLKKRISILAGIDTDGRAYCALSEQNTNADTFIIFLNSLFQVLN